MAARTRPEDELIAAAVRDAQMEARGEIRDLYARRPAALVPDLARARAVELAGSSVGRDQLLSLAFEALAGRADDTTDGMVAREIAGRLGRAAYDERIAVRRLAFTVATTAPEQVQAVLERLEALHRRAPDIGVNHARLAERLAEEATLHELLWDDPAVPADPGARLGMLWSAAALRQRAEAFAKGWLQEMFTGLRSRRRRRGT